MDTTPNHIFDDITEEFDFDHDRLIYSDAPLAGWLKCKRDKIWYAFECQTIIKDLLWHWVLIPTTKNLDNAIDCLKSLNVDNIDYWLSITDDRRINTDNCCKCIRIQKNLAESQIEFLIDLLANTHKNGH